MHSGKFKQSIGTQGVWTKRLRKCNMLEGVATTIAVEAAMRLPVPNKNTGCKSDAFCDYVASFELAAVGIAHVAPDGSWLRVNRAACTMLGYSSDELLGKTFQEVTYADDLDLDVEHVRRLLAGEAETYTIDKRYVRKDGSLIWVSLTVALVRDDDGLPRFFVSVLENIQTRKEMEIALQESEARWKRLLDNLPDVLYQFSTKHGGLFYSPSVEKIFGVGPAYFKANPMHWPQSIHPDELPRVERALDSIRQGRRFAIEYRVKNSNGDYRWVYDRSVASYISDDEIVIEGLAADVTNEKQRAQEVNDTRAQIEEIASSIPGAILRYVRDADGSDHVSYISDGCIDIWELSAEELMREPSPLWGTVHPEDLPNLVTSLRFSSRDLCSWNHEWRIRTRSGVLKWLSGSGKPTSLANGGTSWNSVIIDITAERHARRALDSFFRQRITMNVIVSLEGVIIDVNQMWEELLGYTREELVGRPYIEFVHPDDVAMTSKEGDAVASTGTSSLYFTNRYRHKNGGFRLLAWSSRAEPDEGVIYAMATDVTEARKAEERLNQAATVFSSTAEGVAITDLSGKVKDVNRAFSSITGWPLDEIEGKNLSVLNSGRHDRAFFQSMWRSIAETGNWRGEIWNRTRQGGIYPQLLTISTIRDEENEAVGYVGIFSDISAIKEHERRLDYLAHHDPLTDLPNRLLFDSRLNHSIHHAIRQGSKLAVVFLDLDSFKSINDSMGHAAGDALLVGVAERLRRQIRSADTIARISGDEFVILFEDVSGPEDAAQMVAGLLALFDKPFKIDDTEISMTASMGVSFFPKDAEDASQLMANADAAMYQAKEEGRNTYIFYSSEYTTRAFEYVFLKNALQHALRKSELFLVYQPQLRLSDLQLVGFEVLCRWRHPDQGMISPARFIPIAEQSGLIRDIGRWVLESACKQGRAWLDEGLRLGRLAVNVSAQQFHDAGFVDDVASILARTGFPGSCLELEVTEGFVMGAVAKVLPTLASLDRLGVSIAIDDFGTGYSSLSYLKDLPIDKLKIDQAFVRDIPRDKNSIAIAEAIMAMGKALGIKVIAEGVETAEHAEFMRQYPGIEVQGFFFSRPLTCDDAYRYILGTSRGS